MECEQNQTSRLPNCRLSENTTLIEWNKMIKWMIYDGFHFITNKYIRKIRKNKIKMRRSHERVLLKKKSRITSTWTPISLIYTRKWLFSFFYSWWLQNILVYWRVENGQNFVTLIFSCYISWGMF